MSSTSTLALASAVVSGAVPLADTPSNKAKLLEITKLLRTLFAREQYKPIAHYLGLISDLQAAHDEVAKFSKGTEENRRAYDVATKAWHAARNYAAKYALDEPNGLLRAAGYKV